MEPTFVNVVRSHRNHDGIVGFVGELRVGFVMGVKPSPVVPFWNLRQIGRHTNYVGNSSHTPISQQSWSQATWQLFFCPLSDCDSITVNDSYLSRAEWFENLRSAFSANDILCDQHINKNLKSKIHRSIIRPTLTIIIPGIMPEMKTFAS